MVGAVSATATFAVGILRLIGTYRSSFRLRFYPFTEGPIDPERPSKAGVAGVRHRPSRRGQESKIPGAPWRTLCVRVADRAPSRPARAPSRPTRPEDTRRDYSSRRTYIIGHGQRGTHQVLPAVLIGRLAERDRRDQLAEAVAEFVVPGGAPADPPRLAFEQRVATECQFNRQRFRAVSCCRLWRASMRLVVPHDPVFQHSRRLSWALRGCGGVRHGSEVADDGVAGDGRKITTRPIVYWPVDRRCFDSV